MKRLVSILLTAAMVILSFCGCTNAADESNTNKTTQQQIADNNIKAFDDLMSFDDMMNDIKDVNLYLVPDYKGLTETVEKDDESSTAVKKYYDGDKLVYTKYVGYGEDCFDYSCKSASGRDIVVKYVDESGERYSVDVSSDDYSVSFSELDKKSKHGAKMIYATAEETAENDFPKYAVYVLDNDKLYISNGCYYAEDGYHYYSAYPVDNDFNIESEDILRYECVKDINVDSDLIKILSDYRVADKEIVFGNHNLKFTKDDDGNKKWYIIADVYAVFDSKSKALEFSEKYDIDVNVSDTDDSYWTAKFENAVLPVSNKFDNFFEFAMQEVNDYYYCSIVFDKDDCVKKLDSTTAKLMYY